MHRARTCEKFVCNDCNLFYEDRGEQLALFTKRGSLDNMRISRNAERKARKSKGRDRRIARFIGALCTLARL